MTSLTKNTFIARARPLWSFLVVFMNLVEEYVRNATRVEKHTNTAETLFPLNVVPGLENVQLRLH